MDGHAVDSLVEAFWVIADAAGSDWTAASWCATDDEILGGCSPARWACEHLDARVLLRVARQDSRRLDAVPFGTRLFIKRRASEGWYQVVLASGQYGYVAAVYVKRNLPEPTAELFKIKSQTVLEIVTERYGHLGKDGQDMRFYVNVLEYVNRGNW